MDLPLAPLTLYPGPTQLEAPGAGSRPIAHRALLARKLAPPDPPQPVAGLIVMCYAPPLSASQPVLHTPPQVWECVSVAAELCGPDEAHPAPWTRWVAVLRAGGTPRVVAGRLTAARREVDWALRASVDGLVRRRLADGLHLVAASGTACAFNVRLLVFTRRIHHWARQLVRVDAEWGRVAHWLASLAAHAAASSAAGGAEPLVESLSYASGEWTVAAVMRSAADAPCHQRVLARPSWPADEVRHLLQAGFRVTAAARGPAGSESASVVVLTLMPASVAPLVYRARGSAFGAALRWRSPGSDMQWHEDWAQMPLSDTRPLAARQGVRVHASSTEPTPLLLASRTAVTDIAYSLPWQLGVCASALLDTLMLLTLASDVVPRESRPATEAVAAALGVLVLSLFSVDITLRLFAEGGAFFRHTWNLFDLLLVLVSAAAAAYEVFGEGSKLSKHAPVLLRALRAVRAVVLALRTLDRLERGGSGRRGPPVQHRAAFVIDGDEGTYWQSDRVVARPVSSRRGRPAGSGHVERMTLTIDLGKQRPVEAVSTLWGGQLVHPMPSVWSVLGATEASPPSADRNAHNEPGMQDGHVELHAPIVLATFDDAVGSRDAASPPPERLSAALRSVDRHVDGLTCTFTILEKPRLLRYIQLELLRPAPGHRSYSLRQVQVIGPRLGAPSAAGAGALAASASGRATSRGGVGVLQAAGGASPYAAGEAAEPQGNPIAKRLGGALGSALNLSPGVRRSLSLDV